jgi:hypothetical protein
MVVVVLLEENDLFQARLIAERVLTRAMNP